MSPLFEEQAIDGYLGALVTPAIGYHQTGLACAAHDVNTGELRLSILDLEGKLKSEGHALTTPDPKRVDAGELTSAYPAVAWAGEEKSIYGVA